MQSEGATERNNWMLAMPKEVECKTSQKLKIGIEKKHQAILKSS